MARQSACESKQPAEHRNSPVPQATVRSRGLHPTLQLQRTIGNQRVLHLLNSRRIQPKCACGNRCTRCRQAGLKISQPGDKHEREADRVAARVTQIPDSQIQRQEKGGSGSADPPTRQRLGTKGPARGGRSLPDSVRYYFEPRFGHDFGGVRLHTDERAAKSAEAMGASAYTYGSDVFFGKGQYEPNSRSGRALLAHELTHVVQQASTREARGMVQRAITVQNPGSQAPNPPPAVAAAAAAAVGVPGLSAAILATQTNALMVQGWVDQLCASGGWTVNAVSGVIDTPTRGTFCGARPTRGSAHHTTSGAPTSCGCLCELTAPGATDVHIHVADVFTVGGVTTDVNAAGEGVQVPPFAGHPEHNVGISGLEAVGIRGAGDTSPLAGAGRAQTLRDPPWIIFGHEVCGHSRLHTAFAPFGHVQSPEGDQSATDIENRVRREHSTVASSFGIRRGTFNDATGTFHFGAEYRVSSGETLSRIARRCGIAQADRRTHIFRAGGVAITVATERTLAVGERLLVDGIDWHEVIRNESMTSVATLWRIPLASLIRANPQVADPDHIVVGQRLLVPRS